MNAVGFNMFAEKQPSICLGQIWANTRELLDIVLFQSLCFKWHAPLKESDETFAEEVVVLQMNHIMFHFIIYDHPQFHDLDCSSVPVGWGSAMASIRSIFEEIID